MQDPTPHESGYELADVTLRPVTIAIVFICGLLLLAMVLMHSLLGILGRHEAEVSGKKSPLASYGPQTPPEPRLQTHPADDIRALRAKEQDQLDHYGWVDRNAGVVRLPIERAMQLLAERRGRTAP